MELPIREPTVGKLSTFTFLFGLVTRESGRS